MRFIGVDYGEKRIGIAISDEGGTFAFPKVIIENDGSALDSLVKILKEENIVNVVIGESLNNQGEPNKVLKSVNIFIDKLKEKTEISIYKEKEFFSSVEARRIQGSDKKVDDSAAALILQRFLDKNNKK